MTLVLNGKLVLGTGSDNKKTVSMKNSKEGLDICIDDELSMNLNNSKPNESCDTSIHKETNESCYTSIHKETNDSECPTIMSQEQNSEALYQKLKNKRHKLVEEYEKNGTIRYDLACGSAYVKDDKGEIDRLEKKNI